MAQDDSFHNKIAKMSLDCFETLPKSGKPKVDEWTVMSAIVLEIEGEFSVVALGTGSKCVGRNKLSSLGDILNDSHAEVICRRAFLRYLYDQMGKNDSLLSFDSETKKYVLNDGAKFHFFTTHVPCGDAAIFPKQDSEDFGDVIDDEDGETPKKKVKMDVNRTGAKCLNDSEKQDPKLPGEAYHIVGVVRTKPGRGDPTMSVSCSDKLAKWCHLGIQGALLSLLLDEPVYLSTFTILSGTTFCAKALSRALYERLGEVLLKRPYSACHLIVGTSSAVFEYSKEPAKRPCPSSIVWCKTAERSYEVAVEGKRQGVTKKKLNTPAARLKICKSELFKVFKEICKKREIELGGETDVTSLTYAEVKKMSEGYQYAWKILRKSFKTWTLKGSDLYSFC